MILPVGNEIPGIQESMVQRVVWKEFSILILFYSEDFSILISSRILDININ